MLICDMYKRRGGCLYGNLKDIDFIENVISSLKIDSELLEKHTIRYTKCFDGEKIKSHILTLLFDVFDYDANEKKMVSFMIIFPNAPYKKGLAIHNLMLSIGVGLTTNQREFATFTLSDVIKNHSRLFDEKEHNNFLKRCEKISSDLYEFFADEKSQIRLNEIVFKKGISRFSCIENFFNKDKHEE